MNNDTKLNEWAVVERMGHQKKVGFGTTQYYGDKLMFQVDIPELPEREEETDVHAGSGTGLRLLAPR